MKRILAVCTSLLITVVSAWSLDLADADHLLLRTGFGAPASSEQLLFPLSKEAAVNELLTSVRSKPVTSLPAWANMPPLLPPRQVKGENPNAIIAARLHYNAELNAQARQLQAWWVREILATDSPLTEKMVLFWHNHFTSSFMKVRSPLLLLRQDLLIRKYAFGNYRQFLHALAKDPAMIIYLDNETNRKGNANENFAREVMELFTLGVGHYTEADVKAAARAFTGWRVDPKTGRFFFDARQHDNGQKTFLGQTGDWNGDDIINIILQQKQSSIFIVEQMWRQFISPTPDMKAVELLAARFRESNYDIKTLLKDMLTSNEFWAARNRDNLVKSPIDLLAGMIRTLAISGFNTDKNDEHIAAVSAELGEPLLNPLSVKGWPYNTGWIHSNTLLRREEIVSYLFEQFVRANGSLFSWTARKGLRANVMSLNYELE